MNAKHFIALLRDLYNVLPNRTKEEWQQLNVSPDRPTVILVSGFAATNRVLSVMRRRFLRDGFNVVVLPMDWETMSDSVRGMYRMAEKLSTTVLELRKRSGMGRARVFLVAHSAGGLVARHYVQLLGGSYYTDGLITLATPHSGTWLAVLGLLTHLLLKARVLFQMLPVSRFIRNVNHAPFPHGFHMVSISSKDDLLCSRGARILPPPLRLNEAITTLELDDLSHSDFLMSKQIYKVLITFLRQDGFAMPQMTPTAL